MPGRGGWYRRRRIAKKAYIYIFGRFFPQENGGGWEVNGDEDGCDGGGETKIYFLLYVIEGGGGGGGGEGGSCCSMTSTVNLVNWCGVADLSTDDHNQYLCWTKKNCRLMGRSTFSSAILLTCLEDISLADGRCDKNDILSPIRPS